MKLMIEIKRLENDDDEMGCLFAYLLKPLQFGGIEEEKFFGGRPHYIAGDPCRARRRCCVNACGSNAKQLVSSGKHA